MHSFLASNVKLLRKKHMHKRTNTPLQTDSIQDTGIEWGEDSYINGSFFCVICYKILLQY